MGIPYKVCRYGIGLLAASSALIFIYQGRESAPLLFASLFLLVISITDTFYTKVPNLVNLALVIFGFGFHGLTVGTGGLLLAALGLLAGFGLLLPGYLFRLLGAGDVKALAALGALTGAAAIFQIFLYTSLIGGVLAAAYYLVNIVCSRRISGCLKAFRSFIYTKDLRLLKPPASQIRFPYAAAIAFGYFAYVRFGCIV